MIDRIDQREMTKALQEKAELVSEIVKLTRIIDAAIAILEPAAHSPTPSVLTIRRALVLLRSSNSILHTPIVSK